MVVNCQACGAEIDGEARICHACGASQTRARNDSVDANSSPNLARNEAREDPHPPLPKLPDGGLAAAMPEWLRPTSTSTRALSHDAPATPSAEATDFSTLVSEDDFPDWLRRLADRESSRAEGGTASASPAGDDVQDDLSRPIHVDRADSGHTAGETQTDTSLPRRNRVGTIPAPTVVAGRVPLPAASESRPPAPDRRRAAFAIVSMVVAIAVVVLVLALTV